MAALDPLFVPGGLSPRDARIALGGLLASQGAGLDIRTGVLSGYTVTGTSATGPMRVSVAAGHHVAMRSTSDGPEVGANDGPTTVDIPTAPASNARIDLVWVRATDTERDGSTAAEIGVTATGAVSATPTGPYGDVPAGALVLAEVRVAAGAVRTTDPQVTITNVAEKTVARGAAVPVTSAAKRDALTAFDGLSVKRLDLGGLQEDYVSGGWEGVWQDYTPELYTGGALGGVGNGSRTGRFQRRGKTVHCRGRYSLGSTSSYAGGVLEVTLPVTAATGYPAPVGQATIFQTSPAGAFTRFAVLASGSRFQFLDMNNNAATHTSPALFPNAEIYWNLTYEAA